MNEADRLAYTEFERGILRARVIEYNNFGLGHEDFAPETNTESPAVEAAARDEAEKLLRLELRKARTVDKTDKRQVNGPTQSGLIPTPVLALDKIEVNGFVFSTSARLATMNRKDALEEAKFYDTHGWNTPKTWSGPAQTLPQAA